MSILSEIEKLKDETFIMGLLATLLMSIPGSTILFYFDKNLFLTLDFLKLLLISLAIITPLLLVNFIFISLPLELKSGPKSSKENAFIYLLLSTIFSSFVLYISLLASFILNLSIGGFLYIIMVIEIMATILFVKALK